MQETLKEGDCQVKLLWCLVMLQPSWLSLASPHPGAGIFLSHILTVLCGSSKLVFPPSRKNRWRGGVDLEDGNSCLTLETNRCWHFFHKLIWTSTADTFIWPESRCLIGVFVSSESSVSSVEQCKIYFSSNATFKILLAPKVLLDCLW